MIDWTVLFSSIGAFIFPGALLLDDTRSVIKSYNQVIKEKKPIKFIILSITMYGFILFLGCWLAIYAIWPEDVSLLAWCIAFFGFIIVAPFALFRMYKLLLNMVNLVRACEGIDVNYWNRVEDRAGLLGITSIVVFVGEVGLIIYVLVDILK